MTTEVSSVTYPSTSMHEAASETRLGAAWSRLKVPDSRQTFYREGDSIANRAWRLHGNASIGAALARCLHLNIVGTGLDLVSQYQADDAPDSNDVERQSRRLIRKALSRASSGSRLDAGSQLTREQLLTQVLLSGWFSGGGFMVRTWRDDGTWGTRWRVVDSSRIETPADKITDRTVINGIKCDPDNDRPLGIYIRKRPGVRDLVTIYPAPSADYEYVPWYDAAGELSVIHYMPVPDRAGTLRSVSPMAAVMLRAHHLDQATTAHVAGKRQQASLPLAMPSDNPAAAAAAYQSAREAGFVDDAVSVLFYQRGDAPVFPNVAYQGADFAQFDETMCRSICAAFGFPWQVVLCQLTNGNMASSQAALDQFERAITVYQNAFIETVVRPMDRSLLRESVARGWLGDLPADLDALVVGSYRRPRRPDANRLRTRQAAQAFVALGGSPTTAHAEMGTDYEDETRQAAADAAFAKAQGVAPVTSGTSPAATVMDGKLADNSQVDDAGAKNHFR
jgi:capsid protein